MMKQTETQKYALFLKKLNSEELEKLLSNVLKEMRRRDSEKVGNDVVARTKALWSARSIDGPAA
jgi:hypothetical protein